MTGLHALHMIIGLGLLAWLLVAALARAASAAEYYTPVEIVGPLLALRRHRLDLPLPAALPDRAALSVHMSAEHVVPVRTYLIIFAALIVLTALTTAVAFVDLGALNVVVMLAIAVTKATLVDPLLHARALHGPADADRGGERLRVARHPDRAHAERRADAHDHSLTGAAACAPAHGASIRVLRASRTPCYHAVDSSIAIGGIP